MMMVMLNTTEFIALKYFIFKTIHLNLQGFLKLNIYSNRKFKCVGFPVTNLDIFLETCDNRNVIGQRSDD